MVHRIVRAKSLFKWLVWAVILAKFTAIIAGTDYPQIDYQKLKQAYQHSQYNLGRGYEYWGMMPDRELYAYTALEYLKGADPASLNFEHPPLGKYLLGLSEAVFGNMMVVQFLASSGVLGLTYFLGRRLKLPSRLAAVPVALLVFDPLFGEYSSFTHPDMIHLLAIMVSLCLIVIREKPGRADLWLGLAIGTVAASKAAFNGGVVYLFFLLVDWWKNRRLDPKTYARVGLAGLAIYLISYGVFFLGHNIVEFALLQIKIVRFFRSYLPDYPWFEIFRIIFTGRWRTWFADPPIQPVDSFWPGWPVAISATGLLLAGGFIYKKRTGWPGKETILAAWVATYLIYTSTHLVFPNYLLPILPPAYVCAVFFAWRVVKQIIRKRVAKSGQRERFFPTDS